MKALFPPIGHYAEKSSFPQVSAVYFSVMWLFAPLHFLYLKRQLEAQEDLLRTDVRGWLGRIGQFAIGVVLLPLLGLFALFVNPGFDFNLLPVNSSRLALGVAGFIFAGAGGFALLAFGFVVGRRIFSRGRKGS